MFGQRGVRSARCSGRGVRSARFGRRGVRSARCSVGAVFGRRGSVGAVFGRRGSVGGCAAARSPPVSLLFDGRLGACAIRRGVGVFVAISSEPLSLTYQKYPVDDFMLI